LQILHREILDLETTPCITAFKMDIHQTQTTSKEQGFDAEEEVAIPLYKLRLGISHSSGGLACAEAAGYSLT
jgi:hypothetical protein